MDQNVGQGTCIEATEMRFLRALMGCRKIDHIWDELKQI